MHNKTSKNRAYLLNMPQMHWGGMSENWLLKELGDIHWSMISEGLGIESDKLLDSTGQRLYSTFTRIRWQSSECLLAFKENQDITLNGELSRCGSKMFFSDIQAISSKGEIHASLMSVFSKRVSEDTNVLQKGEPVESANNKIKVEDKIPPFAKEYLNIKAEQFSSNDNSKEIKIDLNSTIFTLESKALYRQDYKIDPFDDINGVGLVYFASFAKINDKCERSYFVKNNKGKKDWAQNSSCIARDIFYFDNANPDDELIYELNVCEIIEGNKIQLGSSLYRKRDGKLIARVFTIKEYSEPLTIKKANHPKLKKNLSDATGNKITAKANKAISDAKPQNSNKLPARESVQKTIIAFLKSFLETDNITESTNLYQLGIESVVYMELSEYLNVNFHFNSNPSHFYGSSTVKNIIDNLLGEPTGYSKNLAHISLYQGGNRSTDIAITAISFRLPEASTKDEFWEILSKGKSVITATPADRWKWPLWVDLEATHKGINYGAYLQDIDKFDAPFFKISPREAELMDPQQRLLLELTWELFEDSGFKPSSFRGTNTGVFIGASGSDYELLLKESDEETALSVTGTSLALLANRLSHFYDLEGPSLQIDTACSSSLVAIHQAINAIRLGECTQAIVGGINLMCHPAKSLSYYQSNMLSVDSMCHTFDEKANGYVRGEGAVIMLIKPLADALNDGSNIVGIIKGAAVNHGGNAGGLTVPNPEKHQKVIENAYKNANIDINTVSYIETHGTGTSLGDPIEILGLIGAFKQFKNAFSG